jgi:hypothetical protein
LLGLAAAAPDAANETASAASKQLAETIDEILSDIDAGMGTLS